MDDSLSKRLGRAVHCLESDSSHATYSTTSCHCNPNSIAIITRSRLGTCQLQAQAPPTRLQAPGSDNAESTEPHILALMLSKRAIGQIRTRKWKSDVISHHLCLCFDYQNGDQNGRSHLITSRKLDVGRQLPNSVVKIAGQVGRSQT